jgi:hypothetical protein
MIFFNGSSITHKDDYFAYLKLYLNWMKNTKVEILEFGLCWPLSVEFISETIRD